MGILAIVIHLLFIVYISLSHEQIVQCSVVEWVKEVIALSGCVPCSTESVFFGILLGITQMFQENGAVASGNFSISVEVHLLLSLWQNGVAFLNSFDWKNKVSHLVLGGGISNVEIALKIVVPSREVEAELEAAEGDGGEDDETHNESNVMVDQIIFGSGAINIVSVVAEVVSLTSRIVIIVEPSLKLCGSWSEIPASNNYGKGNNLGEGEKFACFDNIDDFASGSLFFVANLSLLNLSPEVEWEPECPSDECESPKVKQCKSNDLPGSPSVKPGIIISGILSE